MKAGKLKTFIALPLRDKLFFLDAVLLLSISKMVVLTLPFKKVAPYLGKVNSPIDNRLDSLQTAKAERVKLFVQMAAGNVPFKSVCLDQAMAGMLLLRRFKIPSNLCLGVKRNDKEQKLDAHAWIECGGRILIGGQRSLQYTKVAHFANSPKQAISYTGL